MNALAYQWFLVLMLVVSVFRIGWIDLKQLRIPNQWNVAIASLGLLYQIPSGSSGVIRAIAAAFFILTVLLLLRWLYFRWSGKIGLGLGDIKFIAAATLWIDPWNLPLFFLLASGFALLYAIPLVLGQPGDFGNFRVPFGPFLGAALVLVMLFQLTVFPHFKPEILSQ